MDRIKERIRVGEDDLKMLSGVDQAELDALTEAINSAKRVYVAG